jgi:hypothetical protein
MRAPATDFFINLKLRRRMVLWRELDSSELTRPTTCRDLPRVVEANGPRSLADLRSFVTAERDRLRDEVVKRGGVLLRGFEVNQPADFAEIIAALGYRPEAENSFDTSPRSKVAEFSPTTRIAS